MIEDFEMGRLFGLSRWAQHNHKGLYKEKREGGKSKRRCDKGGGGWNDVRP